MAVRDYNGRERVTNGGMVGSGSTSSNNAWIGDVAYGWHTYQTSSGSQVTSFDTFQGYNVMKMVVTGLARSGGTVGNIGFTNIDQYQASTVTSTALPYLIPVYSCKTYRYSGSLYNEAISSDCRAFITYVVYDAGLRRLTTASSIVSTATVGSWVSGDTTVTMPANAAYIALQIGVIASTDPTVNGTATTYFRDISFKSIRIGSRQVQPSTKCIDFSASTDEVDVGTDYIGTGDVSISAWIKPRSIGSTSGRIIDNGKFFYSLNTNGRLQLSSDGSTLKQSANTSWIPYQWKHVVVTRSSAGITNHYVNSLLSGTADQTSGTPVAGNTNVIIGNSNNQTRNFNGCIADVIVHNHVLTQNEINDLYTRRSIPAGALSIHTFDNTLKDSSGNGHDGTATGTTFSTDVRDVARSAVSANTRLGIRGFGTSINFDGVNGSRVGLGAVISQIDLTKSFTFSCWVNPNIAYAGNIFTQYDTTINSVFAIGIQSNQIRTRLRNISGATDVGSTSSNNFPIPTYKWSHVVYTWDTVSAKLYINNSLQSGTTVNGITSTNNAIAYIGARNNGQNVWNGKIDQVRVFSKALSAQEVNDLYLKGDYPTGNLINQYLFDENTGTTANDSIGNNDGTLTGGVSWSADVPMLARQAV